MMITNCIHMMPPDRTAGGGTGKHHAEPADPAFPEKTDRAPEKSRRFRKHLRQCAGRTADGR